MLNYARKSKYLNVKYLESLDYKAPFFLFDLKKIDENYRVLKKHLSNFTIFYAVKANSEPEIIDRLNKLGSSFEIASINELKLLKKVGVDVNNVIYSNPIKPWQMIEKTFKEGVYRYSFDSVVELQKLAKYAPGSSVYLRFIVNDQGSRFPLSRKFGADPQDIIPLMSMARDLGLVPYGLTFHVGSQSLNPKTWELAIKMAGEAMRELKQEDIEIKMLDIGGGFPADYGEDTPSISYIGQIINKAVEKYLPYKPKLIAEPGRSMVATSGVLVTSVIGRVERGGKNWLHMDVGAFNGMMETLETSNQFKYPISRLRKSNFKTKEARFTVTGPTCDSQDTMFYDIKLPHDTMVDDRICIFSAGAYTTTYASHFNGFEPPKRFFLGQEVK
jgi:ornithine decarboxylase